MKENAIPHQPVLLLEVIQNLKCKPGGLYMDCTLGDGGHAEQILKASGPGGRLIGLDQDPASIKRARPRLDPFGDRVSLYQENFIRLDSVLEKEGMQQVDGILFDLGLSSSQVEDAKRGFSFMMDGPLDMRMDPTQGRTASDLVNTLHEADLTRIFREYGEERWAARISRAIVQRRSERKIGGTGDLVALILKAIPRRYHTFRIHPATRIFQALRVAVNDELSALERGLEVAVGRLKPGGRLCVISFHSLEDRIVKHGLRAWEKEGRLKVITRRPVVAGAIERSLNPRCRSAKLRVAEHC